MSKSTWTKIVEVHGVRIRLFERSGSIYRDVTLGRTVSANGKARTAHDIKSLGHGDRRLAERQAQALATSIAEAKLSGHSPGRLTLGALFAAYRHHRVPGLSSARAREADARIATFSEAWGRNFVVANLSQTHVDLYVKKRRSLEVVSPGLKPDADGKRRKGYRTPKPIGDGGLDAEFRWLRLVLNWAAKKHKTEGRFLLAANPLEGAVWPREKNPRRPVSSHQRYEATMEHVDTVDPAGRLRLILALARHTGRRESAICKLRASDLLLSEKSIRTTLAAAGMDERVAEHMPRGAIRWSDEHDKAGLLFVSPISGTVRREIDRYLRENPRLGDTPLFPAPGRKGKAPTKSSAAQMPIGRETAARWLVKAEALAGLPKLRGGTFHPYRRAWASERKHLPDVDVAAAGGWRGTEALRRSYQHADPATVLRVVEGD